MPRVFVYSLDCSRSNDVTAVFDPYVICAANAAIISTHLRARRQLLVRAVAAGVGARSAARRAVLHTVVLLYDLE